MDDKQFEERMDKLKQSYDHIPTMSSNDKIMAVLKKQEKPVKKRILMQIPIVASFIGVLMIGGVLGMQFISNGNFNLGKMPLIENNQSQTISDKEIESAINEIRGYYERKVDELSNHLEFNDVDQYSFVQEAKATVEKFEDRKNYQNKQELTTQMEKVKEIIDQKVSLPKDEYSILRRNIENGDPISEDDLLSYINKLDILHERYNEKWQIENIERSLSPNIENYVTELNNWDVVGSAIVETLLSNGYSFYEDEGAIYFDINSQKILADFVGHISEQLRVYLEIRSEIREVGDVSVISNDTMEERIIKLEQAILSYPNFEKIEFLRFEYQKVFLNYLKDSSVETLGGFVEEHHGTKSANQLVTFIEKLTENDFVLTDQLRSEMSNSIPSELKGISSYYSPTHLFPLTDSMINVYQEYKKTHNDDILHGPFTGTTTSIEVSIYRIFVYAIEKGDYETAYYLLHEDEDALLPSIEDFIEEMEQKRTEFQTLSNEVNAIIDSSEQGDQLLTYTLIKNNGEPYLFQMEYDKGIPKVVYQSL